MFLSYRPSKNPWTSADLGSLGGGSSDSASGIAVDSAGNAYVTGSTSSVDFPTSNPLQGNAFVGNFKFNAFVTKFNSTGTALIYSTYLGGSGGDGGSGIAVDRAGNAYVTGGTGSADFPTRSPLQASSGGGNDAFVTKLNAAGSALLYSTYLGGSMEDGGSGIAVDSAGNAYVTGTTWSTDFLTRNPLQATNRGTVLKFTAFATKIDAAGALIYSTYLGGSGGDVSHGIAVDVAGNAYVTGETFSTDFPTSNPLQANNRSSNSPFSGSNAFVTKINAAGSALMYSTYLGGSVADSANGIAVDGEGNAYVTGIASSNDFPTVNALQPSKHGVAQSSNAFVTKINPAGSAFVYSTYLGGSGGADGTAIAVDDSGNAYVAGGAGNDFPISNPVQSTNHAAFPSDNNGFVTKINAAGSALLYSTYVGGSGNNVPAEFGGVSDGPRAIAVDGAGNAYATGVTGSTDFPTSNALDASLGGISDAFVLSISPLPPPFEAAGQALSGSGGSGSLNFSFPVDFAWTASSSASWLTLTGFTSGSGNGTLTYLVAPNPGDVRSASITVGGLSFTIEQEAGSISGLNFIGSLFVHRRFSWRMVR